MFWNLFFQILLCGAFKWTFIFANIALFIKKNMYTGGWVLENADVMCKVSIRNADLC